MSIESAISNAQTKVANAYTAIENKGGTLPETQNLANLPTAINSIQGGGILENLLEEIIAGNNPVDTTELQSVETQIHAFLGGGSVSYIVTNVTDVGSSQDFETQYEEVAQALLSGDYTPEPTFYEEDGDTFIEDVTWRDTNDNEVTMTEIIEQATGYTGGWNAEAVDFGEDYITYVTSFNGGGPTVEHALYFTVTIGEAT